MKKGVLIILIIISILLPGKFCFSQCININKAKTIKPPKNDGIIEVSNLVYSGNYIEMYSQEGNFFTAESKNPDDYITIRSGTFNGKIVAQGIAQVTWNTSEKGYYYIHYNSDRTCGHDFKKRDIAIKNVSIPPQEFFWQYLSQAEKLLALNNQIFKKINKIEEDLYLLTFFNY